jgi:hypothetical protein
MNLSMIHASQTQCISNLIKIFKFDKVSLAILVIQLFLVDVIFFINMNFFYYFYYENN